MSQTDGTDPTVPPDAERQRGALRFQAMRPGTTFAGRYRIEERLGAGGSGVVFRARDGVAGQDVALKLLFPGADADDLERLRRELRLVRGLRHPGILHVYDIGESDGLLYTVSELLRGESLARRIQREGALPPREAERILTGILGALAEAHVASVVHRDVKPGNVFLAAGEDRERARVVLLDFGLARTIDEAGLTRTGRFVGTPAYCSPEQIRGERQLGPAADLYACGVTLWEMLAGQPPFRGDSEMDAMEAHLHRPPPSPAREIPKAPLRLRALALHLLEKSPARRPASAAEAERILRGGRLAAAGRFVVREARRQWAERRPSRAVVLAAALAATGFGAAAWLAWPVGVRTDQDGWSWVARGGWSYRGEPYGRATWIPRDSERSFWPSAFVASTDWTALPGGKPGPDHFVRVRFPGNRAEPVLKGKALADTLCNPLYAFANPCQGASVAFPLPRRASDDGIHVAVLAGEQNYPSRVLFLGPADTPLLVYDHPGRMECMTLLDRTGDRPRVLVAGTNNLLGSRPVVVALPLDNGIGQAPPYTAEARLPEIASWYLPLPYSTRQSPTALEPRGDDVEASWGPGKTVRIDPRLGVPSDDAARHGLSKTEWGARRDALMNALRRAAGTAEAGAHAEAAARLEAFAGELDGPPEVVSIAWYRAAELRRAAARGGGRGELETGLRDIERALATEIDPPRYGLLQGEILLRLRRSREALRALHDWRGRPAPDFYSFEWLVLNWMAGSGPSTASSENNAQGKDEGNWQMLVRMTAAMRRGDFDGVLVVADEARDPGWLWDQHRYWAARACLDRADPDPERALRELQLARTATRGMVPMPIDLAEARARMLADPRAPLAEPLRRAAVESFRLAVEQAHVNPEAWFLLHWAKRDAEALLVTAPETAGLRDLLREADELTD